MAHLTLTIPMRGRSSRVIRTTCWSRAISCWWSIARRNRGSSRRGNSWTCWGDNLRRESRVGRDIHLGKVFPQSAPKQTFTLPIPDPSRRQEVPLVRVGVIGGLESVVDITCQPRRAVLLFESRL